MISSPVDPCLTGLLELGLAMERILNDMEPVKGTEQVTLKKAMERVLSQPVHAPISTPAFDNSAMDGYAVQLTNLHVCGSFKIIGAALAGQPYQQRIGPGECVRIFTGAPLPQGCEAVIRQEDVLLDGGQIKLKHIPCRNENIRRAGEDVKQGEQILGKGQRLTNADIGLLASLGISTVTVFQKPRVGFFSTGNELCPLDSPLSYGQIYESNRYSLYGLLSKLPVSSADLGSIPDEMDATIDCLEAAGQDCDVIISSGGASVGEADLLRHALTKTGQLSLWKVGIKPGKPFLFGRVGQAWYFGLPGNPVSVHVTFSEIVQPALWKLAGVPSYRPLRIQVPCRNTLKKTPGRLEFQRGRLTQDRGGQLTVTGLSGQGSHHLKSLSQANCYIVLPADCDGVKAGEQVEVEPFESRFFGNT